ncbi:hypothetical protein NDA01_27920 [Trichocoleus desertorum AS-A10]
MRSDLVQTGAGADVEFEAAHCMTYAAIAALRFRSLLLNDSRGFTY